MAVILAITILGTGLIGSYTTVPAAEFSAGALAASETLQWITAALGAVGISISVKELLKPRQADIEKDIGKHIDWDNYDWGDALDSPAAQDQIDELDKTINKLYGNASAKWKEMYEKSLSPTPTPETSPDKPDPSPPVTVAPIDPDKVTPPGWDTLRKASMKNGYLALGAATYWCLKEAAKGLWDTLFDNNPSNSNPSNPYSYKDLVGHMYVQNSFEDGSTDTFNYYLYSSVADSLEITVTDTSESMALYLNGKVCSDFQGSAYKIVDYNPGKPETHYTYKYDNQIAVSQHTGYLGFLNRTYSFDCYLPYVLNGQSFNAAVKPYEKSAIWPSTDLKNDYDNNKSPSIPAATPAPAIKIPSLDDLKDLQKKGNDASDDDRPSIILDWLKNHYTNPSTDPQPTTAPDPDPNPTTAPNPDPDPDPDPKPTTTPAVNPKPSTAPKPSGTPENPDDTDINPDDYKADLRLVFPFCIPFDLVHLIQAFEAEPEAPVFEFPLDLELENPWTDKKILDYHHVFKLDMSDYEPVIKIFRIFEIIFFIIGLLMITRQQMIKG